MNRFKRIMLLTLESVLLATLFMMSRAAPVQAQSESPQNQVVLYFFWGDGCPHCAKAKPFLIGLAQTKSKS